jgi:hypothetical protein
MSPFHLGISSDITTTPNEINTNDMPSTDKTLTANVSPSDLEKLNTETKLTSELSFHKFMASQTNSIITNETFH